MSRRPVRQDRKIFKRDGIFFCKRNSPTDIRHDSEYNVSRIRSACQDVYDGIPGCRGCEEAGGGLRQMNKER